MAEALRGSDPDDPWIAALVKDLQEHRGSSLVMTGQQQLPEVHALTHAMNAALGNVGQTLEYTEPWCSSFSFRRFRPCWAIF